MNVNSIVSSRECTSCQMCAAVCARDAISIALNEDGFYRPHVDAERCTDCGLCTKVCYRVDDGVSVTDAGESGHLSVYSAQSVDDTLLGKVTSGGVADALAKSLVGMGYVCVGVRYNAAKCRAEHTVAETVAETDAFRGSKYIQSYSLDAMKALVGDVRNRKYAVFGLPCHIYAVRKFLSLRHLESQCILIDLFCHGCPSMLVWNKYEREIRRRAGVDGLDDVQFRSKAKGWGAFHVSAEKDGRRMFVSTPLTDEFYSLFFSDQLLNGACSDCKLRSTMAYTDIRLGDFWGKRFLGDKKGVSAVAVASERGNMLFEAVKDKFRVGDSSLSEVLVKQSYGKVYRPEPSLRKALLDSLRDEDKPLNDAERLYVRSLGMVARLKRIVKFIDGYMPFDLFRFLKRFA